MYPMQESDSINVDRDDLENFFAHHLNKIYTAKTLLVSELPQLLDNAHFTDLKEAIDHTIEDVRQQILRMDKIYELLPIAFSKVHSNGMNGLMEDSFSEIQLHSENPELRDMSILFYLQIIECIEMATFQVLEMAFVKLENDQVKNLIRQNYEASKADRTLFLLISAKYISTV
jgi:ferritin-like metal-binding protein YciE